MLMLLGLALVGAGPTDGTDVSPEGTGILPGVEGGPSDAAPAAGPVITPQNHPLGPAFATGGRVAIIPVDGTIYGFTLDSLKRRVEDAIDGGASVIVIRINTKGGVLTAGLDISKYIKTIPVYTLAWINPEAYSAGIMIAAACDAIVMSPASATGDCAPVALFSNLAPPERAKILSPVLEEFRDSARDNGYDYTMFHAMCELGVKLYLVEHIETGRRRLVNQIDYEVMVNGRDPTDMSWVATVLQLPAGVDAPVEREVSRDDDVRMWTAVKQLPSGTPLPNGLFHDGRTLLTVNQDRALDIGLSKGTIRTDNDLQQFLGAASLRLYPHTWSQTAASWLTHPVAKALLTLMLMLGIYIELQSPGLGLGGFMAVVALLGLIVAPYLVGLVQIWHILAFFLGFILLMVEVFVTPGFGVLGIAGVIMMCVGLVFVGIPTAGGGGIPGALPAPEMMAHLQASAFALIVAVVLSGVGFYFLARHFGTVPVLSRMILRDSVVAAAEEAEDSDMPMPPPGQRAVSGDEALGDGAIRVGDAGIVVTGLRPTGRADIAGHTVDVTSHGSWIETGRPVRVVEIHGNIIVVEPT
jgi:membrane-bound serine protease (ClpP class)